MNGLKAVRVRTSGRQGSGSIRSGPSDQIAGPCSFEAINDAMGEHTSYVCLYRLIVFIFGISKDVLGHILSCGRNQLHIQFLLLMETEFRGRCFG